MSSLMGIFISNSVGAGVIAIIGYTIYGAIYRLYLSPVAGFPGPKLAGLTLWYEFYYDVYPLKGQYTFHIRELHKKYGPIIRINPWELHISTPEFYDTLYSSTQRRDKWDWFVRTFGLTGGSAATVDHNLHKIRRAALNPYFSIATVRKLQPVIEDRMEIFIDRLRGLAKTGEVQRIVVMLSALSSDVIMMYCFGRSYQRLEKEDFDVVEHDATHEAASMAWVMKHNIWILWIVRSLPGFLVARLGVALAAFQTLQQEFRAQVRETLKQGEDKYESLSHPTIFQELLKSKLPSSEKTADRLADEAQSVVIAGQETTAWSLTVIFFHLLSNPVLLKKLKSELAIAIPDSSISTPQVQLERLPYLTAVIKEGLRLSYGLSSRSQRIPLEPLTFSASDRDWVIPAGTPVGMTSVLIHHNETIFPKSKSFQPERWIDDQRLDRYLVAFSRGHRQCVGMPLAYAEMYLWLAGVFRRFGSRDVRFEGDEGALELVGTDISDVEIESDCFLPGVKEGSKGVRFRVLK